MCLVAAPLQYVCGTLYTIESCGSVDNVDSAGWRRGCLDSDVAAMTLAGVSPPVKRAAVGARGYGGVSRLVLLADVLSKTRRKINFILHTA